MSKPRSIQLSIPNPCSKSWDEMRPEGQGRFCDQCQKIVIDFTTWSDAALYNFFSKNAGHVCGRYLTTQLDRPIRIPYQPHSKLYRIAIAVGFTLTLAQSPHLMAQNRPPWLPVQCRMPLHKKPVADSPATLPGTLRGTISGRVFDERKEPMVNAVIQVFRNSIAMGGCITDFDGNYTLEIPEPGEYMLLARYAGYDSILVNGVKVNNNNTIVNLAFDKSKIAAVGELRIMVGYRRQLFDTDEPTKRTFTRDDIDHMPNQ